MAEVCKVRRKSDDHLRYMYVAYRYRTACIHLLGLEKSNCFLYFTHLIREEETSGSQSERKRFPFGSRGGNEPGLKVKTRVK